MYRSSSSARVSEEFFSNSSSSSAAAAAGAMSSTNHKPATTTSDLDHLPTYNPMSHLAKKEKSRLRSVENSIHLIPVLLVLCAIVLWFFSSPVDLVNKSDSVVARIESSLIKSGVDRGHGKSSLESTLKQEDLNPANQSTEGVDPVNQSADDEVLDNQSTGSAEHNTIR
ncbi:unnamed protein product [Coffea canephora]|uniref:Transmembrane protein n=1 Tax=Coffea canephora TaxID=49390 RepID=A0A068UL66_COFCA|nr:unnamed protein product [Coffea canephora]